MKAKKNLAISIFVLLMGMWMISAPTGNLFVDVISTAMNIFFAGCNFMLWFIINYTGLGKVKRK